MNDQISLTNFTTLPPFPPNIELVWVGAASFEDRCTGSVRELAGLETRISNAVLLDYPTKIQPQREGELKRSRNRGTMLKLLPSSPKISAITIINHS